MNLLLLLGSLLLSAAPAEPASPASAPLDIVSDRLTVDQETGEAVFSGNVRLRRLQLEVRCRELKVRYGGNKGRTAIEHLTFTGPVELQLEGRRGACRGAEYFRKDQRLVCSGEAWLEEGGSRIEGDAIEYFLDSRRVLVTRPRAVLELEELEKKEHERKP